jgi:thioesterase domain-containing protein
MTSGPPPTMISVLTPIWERVLRKSPIGVNESFFDLGGDSSLAEKLFARIREVCGRELPVESICRAPTIGALATCFDRPIKAPLSPLVPLNGGTEQPPVFIAHGLDGGVVKFFPLVRHIPSPHPIYGIQAKGFHCEQVLNRIEDMVPPYLDAIQKVQQYGPYLLIGYSFGGLVMLEIAQRLLATGEKVALLAMLDSYPHLRHLSPAERARVIALRVKGHLSEITQSSPRDALSYVIRRWQHRSRSSKAQGDSKPPSPMDMSPTLLAQFVEGQTDLALSRYRPKFYPGKITFLQSETESYFPVNPRAVWAHLASEFECETVPGDHQGMLTTHFDRLGAVLSRYLREASSE